MRKKNKFYIVALVVYILILLILAFTGSFIKNVNVRLADLFTDDIDTLNLLSNIFKYIELVIFYGGLGIVLTIFCIDNIDEFMYILLISIMGSLMLVVVSSAIKSFFIPLNFIDVLVCIISILAGVGLEILIKIKQIRGLKDEDSK